jgi:hypothetical protein
VLYLVPGEVGEGKWHLSTHLSPKNRVVSMILGRQGFPKKDLDRHILFISATLGLDPQRRYTERELNSELRKWTTRFGSPVNLDHVSLRRFFVDEHCVRRDSASQSYELTTTGWPYTFDPSIRALDLEALIDEAMTAREPKTQQYLSRSAGQQPGSSKLSSLGSRQEVGEMRRTGGVDRPK